MIDSSPSAKTSAIGATQSKINRNSRGASPGQDGDRLKSPGALNRAGATGAAVPKVAVQDGDAEAGQAVLKKYQTSGSASGLSHF